MPVLVELRGVSKHYRRADTGETVVAVEDVSLDVHQGEVLGVIGYSGAGKALKQHLLAAEGLGAAQPYGVGGVHRHIPEIEQNLQVAGAAAGTVTISFTPTLVPMSRGILATATARLAPGADAASVRAAWETAYADEPFVHLLPTTSSGALRWPTTAAALGANCIFARRTKSAPLALASLALAASVALSLAASAAMLAASSLNYPGGEALAELRALVAHSGRPQMPEPKGSKRNSGGNANGLYRVGSKPFRSSGHCTAMLPKGASFL